MMPLLAKAVVEVTDAGGDHVVIDSTVPMQFAALYLFLLLLPFVLVLLLAFYRSRHRHLQILAAMEKGLPISDLIAKPQLRNKEVNWIRSLSAGIGFLFVGIVIPIICFVFGMINPATPPDEIFGMLIIPTGVCGLGLILLMRGILQKNYEKQKQKENTTPTQ